METQLAAPVTDWLTGLGAACVAQEVDAGFGVPDLVAGMGSPARLRERLAAAPPLSHLLEVRVLEFCRYGRTEAELRGWSPRAFPELRRRALRPLLSSGLLVSNEDRVQAIAQPVDPFDALVAIELKLSDITRGLRQAHGYRAFADQSYLAVPAARVTSKAMEAARAHSVGLLAVHPMAVEVAVEPPLPSAATASRRRLASERVMSAYVDGDRRPAGSARR